MPFDELSENDIAVKMKDLMKSGDFHNDVLKQYYHEIYNRFYYHCYNISRYYGLNSHDAEDAVQESFIKLYKNIGSYDGIRSFKPWFFKIVLNCVRDKYRDIIKHTYIEIEKAENYGSNEQKNLLDEFHVREALHSIIIRLPEKLKSAVILRNYSGLDLKAAADLLNLSVRQLQNRLSKAYTLIKEELENEN
jgi:RNA polymerase sigma-70 factor (ECF subfamily)